MQETSFRVEIYSGLNLDEDGVSFGLIDRSSLKSIWTTLTPDDARKEARKLIALADMVDRYAGRKT